MTEEERAGLDALRDFLRPTIRRKLRGVAVRTMRKLFPPKERPLFATGDILSFNGQEKVVARCRGRFVEFTDGSEVAV